MTLRDGTAKCKRCDKPKRLDELHTVSICLNGESATGLVCVTCQARCLGDIGEWMMYLTPTLQLHGNGDARPKPHRATVTDVPFRGGKVPIPVRRRVEVINQPEPKDVSAAPEILHGVNQHALQQAADRWSWRRGARAEALGRNVDPIVALLTADSTDGITYKDEDGSQVKILYGIKVRLKPAEGLIMSAYPA